ncbi:alpha/beta fold hydrolase [Chlorobium phaeobacteroides]|uniref:Alpha/beta hydrolase fold protein n=1 Tax=Chlorobium phaeobacteroides (strain DSM 266 / SMG 266 / 2430) TaxID=290317 RepID=A1BIP1_CHLPD|nr:alpha/beta hydrolase [Chlorobium phaeobacteroides]ABL66268.1 alpha/beta hydrolase fold protein [Chlorobium phaeobacteroides DSM 266]
MLSYQCANTDQENRSGYAVLLLHAFPLSAEMWRPQLDALGRAGFVAIAPNSFGIEGSEEKKDWSFTDYAHQLAELLDSLHCRKVTVVGLSMGGYQAFAFLKLYPEKIASIVLCDTRAENDALSSRQQRQEFIIAVQAHGPEEAVRRMLPNYFSSKTAQKKPELPEQAAAMIRKQSGTAIIEAMKAIMTREDATPLLSNITCPVLVLNGEEDRLTTPETAAGIQARIPGALLGILPEAAHLSNMEQPARFNALLLEHIQAFGAAR